MPSNQSDNEAQQINVLNRKVLDAAMIVHTALIY